MKKTTKTASLLGLLALSAQSLNGGLVSSTPSMSTYATGPAQLVAYTDVPGHIANAPMLAVKPGINPQNQVPLKIKSDIFTIRVKSAATDNLWVDCFTNFTYNRGAEVEDIIDINGFNQSVSTQNYQNLTAGWTHSYANIETTPNTPVDVEISLIAPTLLDGKNVIEKFAVHPFDKATNLLLQGGKIYFTIQNPGQVVIDINGQMDDHNAAINPMTGNAPVHAVTLFANPILAKPVVGNPGVVSIAPGAPIPNPSTFSTLVFQPGVHQIGLSFPLHPGKSYYIPGDAYLLGTFSNLLSPKDTFRTKGDSIRMFGYGTISGASYIHYLYPGYIEGPTNNSDRTIVIEEGVSCELFGMTIIDPFNHSLRFFSWSGSDQASDKSFSRWMKPITWRANGDGIGGGTDLEDCFLRTADDSTYATGNRTRCVFWKDVNAAICHMPDIPRETIYFQDCDIIYNRLRTANGSNGGCFQLRDGGKGLLKGDFVARNVRFLDKRSNMSAINFNGSTGTPPGDWTSFTGVRFENVSIEPPIGGRKQFILGDPSAPWFGGITFKNVTFGGVPLTAQNFDTYFTRNVWVDYMLFNDPLNLTLTTSANATQGEIRRNLTQSTYPEMSPVVLTAVAKAGDFVFSHWSGGATGSENPLTVWMTGNKSITANFIPATIAAPVLIQFPSSGSWVVPAGVYSLTLDGWGAGGAGGSAYNGNTSGTNTQARGGGGAGGAFSSRTFRVSPGQVINYAVGAGGLAAGPGFSNNTNATAGGASSASVSTQSILALGGPGGKNVSISNQNISGIGGIAPLTGNSGATTFHGGDGGAANSSGSGGGGGSAGSQGIGADAVLFTEGAAGLGGGATGGTGHNSTNEGQPGGSPGAGGSGAGVRSDAFSHRTGGNGGDGRLLVTYNTMPFTLTTNTVGSGSITIDPPSGSYISGATVTVTAVPAPGYLFTGWSGTLSGTANPNSILMDDNKTLTATFEVDPLAGSVWDGGGSADGLGNFNWSADANWVITAPAAGNLVFAGMTGLTTFNNLAADTAFLAITFNNTAGAFTLSGNRITLGGNIINQSNNLQTLNLPLILSPSRSFDAASGNLAVNGILSGTGGFIKSGSGSLILSAASTYSGTANIQNGTLVLKGGNDRLPATGAVILGATTPAVTTGILQLGDAAGPVNQTLNSLTTPSDATNRVVGGNENLSTLTLLNTSGIVTFNGTLGGTGTFQNNLALVKAGSGTLALRSVSTLTGPTAIQNGTIEIANGDNRLPATTSMVLGSGTTSGVLQLGNSTTARSQTLASLTTSGTGDSNRVVGLHATNFPRLTLNNSSNIVYAGTLGGPTTNNNRINFTKGGSGTLTLSGTNTFFGTTSVTLGTLLITGDSSAAVGAVDVTGGILGGTGSIGGSVTLAASGSLSPGTGVGTFTIGGGLNFSAMANGGTGKLNFELGPIATSDKVIVSGALNIGSGVLGFSDFNFTRLSGLQNGTYKLISNVSSLVGTLDPLPANRTGALTPGNGQGTLQVTGNEIELVVTGVGPGPVAQFSISGIASPQTVGTPITGITITARDASNATATSFNGTVTFGGTGGFSGTSATFTAGVLSGLSITPTLAGSNLTFTVTDSTPITGMTTITTIRTRYEAWAGSALFNDDANNDGVKNGLAWLLGASSPVSSVNLPVVTQNTNGLIMTFTMLNAANRGPASLRVEHSSDLGITDAWTAASIPETTNAIPSNGVTFVITPAGQLNSVEARISNTQASSGRLFSRLKTE